MLKRSRDWFLRTHSLKPYHVKGSQIGYHFTAHREGCLQEGGTSSRFAPTLRRADGALASWTPAAKRRGQAQVQARHVQLARVEGGCYPVLFLWHVRRAGRAGRVGWEASPPAEPRLQGGSCDV